MLCKFVVDGVGVEGLRSCSICDEEDPLSWPVQECTGCSMPPSSVAFLRAGPIGRAFSGWFLLGPVGRGDEGKPMH